MSVFGESRPATVYVGAYDGCDGFECPFCLLVTVRHPHYSLWPRRANPWCAAMMRPDDPNAPAAWQAFIDAAHDAALREEEERRRRRNHALTMRWIAEERRARDAWWAAERARAVERGACLACFERGSDYYLRRAKVVRHRGPCPLAARATT